MQHADVAVIGGGIVGLAFAAEAARRGRSVVLFERSAAAHGASVRNFGMIWPIGQPLGPLYRLALRSRSRWLELAQAAGIWVHECGSVHVAHADDEQAVLQEFAETAAAHGVNCEYLPAADAIRRFPAINPNGLRGVLYSPVELGIDPRQAVKQLPRFLTDFRGVQLQFDTTVIRVEMPQVCTAAGDVWTAEQVIICSGTDFETLFPDVFVAAGIRRCKLQMMRTAPQPNHWRLGPHVAGGLTLCHYKAFESCRTLPVLQQRIAAQFPEYVRYGIHVMASQNQFGEILIGDSHEYDGDVTPFDNPQIDDLILAYLRQMIRLPDERIVARWHGVYAKHTKQPVVITEPQPGCTVVTAVGGAGMTLSFGLAQAWWDAREQGRSFDLEAV
jgi:FAD dependent oxidoreductase TIGR03364